MDNKSTQILLDSSVNGSANSFAKVYITKYDIYSLLGYEEGQNSPHIIYRKTYIVDDIYHFKGESGETYDVTFIKTVPGDKNISTPVMIYLESDALEYFNVDSIGAIFRVISKWQYNMVIYIDKKVSLKPEISEMLQEVSIPIYIEDTDLNAVKHAVRYSVGSDIVDLS